MSVFKKKNALANAKFNYFEGIDCSTPLGKYSSAQDMINFRIRSDGSIEKRSGFEFIYKFPEEIRGIWAGTINGGKYMYMACSNKIYRIKKGETEPVQLRGSLSTTSGDVNIVCYRHSLFALDGRNIYTVSVDKDMIMIGEGYVPLIGRNWPSATVGSEYESPNYATSRVKISYVVSNPPNIYLCTKYDVSKIDAIYINGVKLTDTSRYYYDSSLRSVCILNMSAGDYVMLYLTLKYGELGEENLLLCKRSAIYGGMTDRRLFLWDGIRNNLMFGSQDASSSSLAENQLVYPYSGILYFPRSSAIEIGREGNVINGISRQYDRMLIFSDTETWMSNSADLVFDDLKVMTINYSHGCSSPGGSTVCENEPISVSNRTILRWTADTDELNECNAYSISSAIDELLDSSFYQNAVVCFDKANSEVLFSDPATDDGIVWVYNIRNKMWYKFSGINAKTLFYYDDRIGFCDGYSIYLFNEELHYDTLADGSKGEIVARYESNVVDFDMPDRQKRLCGSEITADFDGGNIEMTFVSDNESISDVSKAQEASSLCTVTSRLNSKRFKHLSLRIDAPGEARQRIFGACLSVKA